MIKKMLILALVVLGGLVMLGALVWAGFQVKPGAFPSYDAPAPPLATVPLPDDLPAPVVRFFGAIAGDTIPVINSAVLTGRARLRLNGIGFQGRFRFTYEAGAAYRHYIEGTCFGLPLLKVNETYLDGHARLELPVGTTENNAYVDSAANQGLWGESMWLPTIYLTDPRVRWETIDADHARLVVPFGEDEQTFTVTFDPQTGLLHTMETTRYKGTGGDPVGWLLETQDWATFHGLLIPARAAVTWADEDQPWAVFTVEDVVYNPDVSAYIRQKGL